MGKNNFYKPRPNVYGGISWDDLSEVATHKAARALGISEERLREYTIDQAIRKLSSYHGDHYTLTAAIRYITRECEDILHQDSPYRLD